MTPHNMTTHITWTVGESYSESPLLTIDSFADSTVDIGLTTSTDDPANIAISFGDTADLAAFGTGLVSGSFTTSATSTGTVVVSHGVLTGYDSTTLSLDLTASLDDATINLQVTDKLNFSLFGYGYTGASITQINQTGGSATAGPAPSSSSQPMSSFEDDGTFDLAKFVASVVNTKAWDVQFLASAPGESLFGQGLSVLTIDATAELPGAHGATQQLTFDKTIPSYFAFSEPSFSIPNLFLHI